MTVIVAEHLVRRPHMVSYSAWKAGTNLRRRRAASGLMFGY
jgi:hypothetical protein